MALQCGIVGLPNVGKSTLFNALTQARIAAENYPFCTIDPNVGVVAVPDMRLQALAAIVKPQKIIPTTVEFVDIAGLVAGASQGEGLGNQFLAHIRESDAIAHVVRCFEDDDIIHVAGVVDPFADIEIINTELLLADLATVERALQAAVKGSKSGNIQAREKQRVLTLAQQHLDAARPARSLAVSREELSVLRDLHLLTLKPTMYIANVREDGFVDNPLLEQVKTLANNENTEVVPVCAALEAEIAQLEEEEKSEFLEEIGLQEAGLDRVIRAAYRLLGLSTYFTAGEKEVRAWTIPVGASAVEAAGVIHTDFAHGFIRAEVISFEDYIHYRGEQGAKDAGRWRLEGKEYSVYDGDVVHFRFNV